MQIVTSSKGVENLQWAKEDLEISYEFMKDLKIRMFQITVESILLYGPETWTVLETLAERIDGCDTKMLKMVLDVHW